MDKDIFVKVETETFLPKKICFRGGIEWVLLMRQYFFSPNPCNNKLGIEKSACDIECVLLGEKFSQ